VHELIRVEMPDSQVIWALLEDTGGRDVAVDSIPRVLSGLTETIRGVAGNIRQAVVDARPDQVQVEFGIQLAAGGSGVVAALVGVNGNSSIRVTLGWTSTPTPANA
jgi:hypothetical protein